MNKRIMVLLLAGVAGLFIVGTVVVNQMPAVSAAGGTDTYLPIVVSPPPTPTPIPHALGNVVKNSSFEDGWTDLPPVAGWLINQQPKNWKLTWIEPGELLYDSSGDRAAGIPECVHKLADQLPDNEKPGGPDALILDGVHVYKWFTFGAPFGAELTQTVSGLTPGTYWRLVVPIQVHLHGDTGPYAAESGVWVNGQGEWVNGADMGDRQWYEHVVYFTVPADGKAVITIRVKSKWEAPKDFFIDFLQ